MLESVAWTEWPAAVADACGHVAAASGATPHLAAIRGGALIDGMADVAARWRFAPAGGAGLFRDLARARSLAAVGDGSLDHGGYPIAPALAEALGRAEPAPLPARVARLADDPLPADARIDAAPIWRVSEPVAAAEMADAIATDIAEWLTRCAA